MSIYERGLKSQLTAPVRPYVYCSIFYKLERLYHTSSINRMPLLPIKGRNGFGYTLNALVALGRPRVSEHSRPSSIDQRLVALLFLTAMANAFF